MVFVEGWGRWQGNGFAPLWVRPGARQKLELIMYIMLCDVYVYTCVCMYIYMYIYIYILIFIFIFVFIIIDLSKESFVNRS